MQAVNLTFAAKQLGHGVDQFLKTYSKWLDGAQSAAEMAKFEAALQPKEKTA